LTGGAVHLGRQPAKTWAETITDADKSVL